jgi:hypothetical protein
MAVTKGLKDMKVAEIANTMQQNAGKWLQVVVTVPVAGTLVKTQGSAGSTVAALKQRQRCMIMCI